MAIRVAVCPIGGTGLGHALGIFDHHNFGGAMGGIRPRGIISPREAALLRSLYQVPHGAKVLPDGTWEVPALLPPSAVRLLSWGFGSGSTITFTWSATFAGGAPADYVLEIGTAPGLSDHAVLTTTGLSTSVTLVPGAYYARVKARNAGGTGLSAQELHVSFAVYPP